MRARIAVDCFLLATPKVTAESIGCLRAGDVIWIGAECEEWILTRGGWLPRCVVEVAPDAQAANERARLTTATEAVAMQSISDRRATA